MDKSTPATDAMVSVVALLANEIAHDVHMEIDVDSSLTTPSLTTPPVYFPDHEHHDEASADPTLTPDTVELGRGTASTPIGHSVDSLDVVRRRWDVEHAQRYRVAATTMGRNAALLGA
jgi:hypothetical protein